MSTESENFEIPDNWEVKNDQLCRKFEFPSYSQCVDFTNQVAHLAETQNHHPGITLEYSSVTLNLYSHVQGEISERDINFALKVNELTI